ncbi:MAG: winged helix-turn-helix transcriptional regulator [Hyphomicrobiales bacterium]
MSLERSIGLFHHRWAPPVVAALQFGGELSAGELARRIEGSRDATNAALRDLMRKGLVEVASTGRPRTYRLSAFGARMGPRAAALASMVTELGVYPVVLRKWAMPVVAQVGRGYTRYHELENTLPGVTPRALALALRDLMAVGLIERSPEPGYAGARIYALTEAGRRLFEPLDGFVQAAGELPD